MIKKIQFSSPFISMLDIKFIRENPEKVKQACENKQVKVDIDKLLKLDKQRRNYIQKSEKLRAEQKKLGRENISKAKEIKARLKADLKKLSKIEKEFNDLMFLVPNIPLNTVPFGKSEKDNVIMREFGKKPTFDFKPKSYLEIAEKLNLIDMKRGAKLSGTRFGYLKSQAVLLEFALINLALDVLLKQGFIPIDPPVMIRPKMMKAMGYLERGEDEVYFLRDDELCLVGTSEQSIGPMHAEEIFKEKDLPKRYLGFSSCFRREAGSWGKDTKGIFRVHQFYKIEMFSFAHPKKSLKEHQLILSLQEKLMKILKIPYRVVQMCTADLGDPAAAKYDIEAWMPSEQRYRETHSSSNCTDFQARRLNIRYRTKESKLDFVHTVNGTAFAIGRTLITIIENYQQKDGSIKVPLALQKYLKFKIIK